MPYTSPAPVWVLRHSYKNLIYGTHECLKRAQSFYFIALALLYRISELFRLHKRLKRAFKRKLNDINWNVCTIKVQYKLRWHTGGRSCLLATDFPTSRLCHCYNNKQKSRREFPNEDKRCLKASKSHYQADNTHTTACYVYLSIIARGQKGAKTCRKQTHSTA